MTEMEVCPRCRGTGSDFPGMICGTCYGKKVVEKDSTCSSCKHSMSYHDKLENIGRLDCGSESGSGQFMCGCQGPDGKITKPICNVCGKNQGNSYCLDGHLKENPKCKDGFKIKFYPKW